MTSIELFKMVGVFLKGHLLTDEPSNADFGNSESKSGQFDQMVTVLKTLILSLSALKASTIRMSNNFYSYA